MPWDEESRKPLLGDRTQPFIFLGNENPLTSTQAEARHIHICILDENLWWHHGVYKFKGKSGLGQIPQLVDMPKSEV